MIKNISSKQHLDRHISNVHERKKPYDCKVCNSKFATKGSLKNHMNVHEERNLFGCNNCTKTYQLENSLRRHIKNVHGGKKSL